MLDDESLVRMVSPKSSLKEGLINSPCVVVKYFRMYFLQGIFIVKFSIGDGFSKLEFLVGLVVRIMDWVCNF